MKKQTNLEKLARVREIINETSAVRVRIAGTADLFSRGTEEWTAADAAWNKLHRAGLELAKLEEKLAGRYKRLQQPIQGEK